MRNLLFGLGILGIVGAIPACGGDDKAKPIDADPTRGGRGGTGNTGKSGSSNTSGDAGAGGSELGEGAPTVQITAPEAVTDPNDEAVLTGTEVTVTCLARSDDSGSPVDASSVKVSLLDAEGAVIETKPAAPTTNFDEYSVIFELTEVAAGKLGFSCAAENENDVSGHDERYSLFDKGPTITFASPLDDSAYPLATPLDIKFSVTAAPLGDDDAGANLANVSFEIGGKEIDLAGKSDGDGNYQFQVNLADPDLFRPAPTGALSVVVNASNSRAPKAAEATVSRLVQIDGDGPRITIESPPDAAVVGGKVTLKFSIEDAIAGVDPSTVTVSLNDVEYKYSANDMAWGRPDGDFSFEFDSRQFASAKVQITVHVTAKDKVGNVSETGAGASELLYLDNFSPLIDLDPQNIRTHNALNECSKSFDPVGDMAKNDLRRRPSILDAIRIIRSRSSNDHGSDLVAS